MQSGNIIKGILFDMDGVLLDTERLSTKAWLEVANKWGIDLSETFINSFKGMTVDGSKHIFLKRFGCDFPYHFFRAERNKYVQQFIKEEGVPVKKGVYEILDYAKARNIKTAIATSTKRSIAEEYLKSTDILDRVDHIVCGDEIIKSKPEPDIYLEAAYKIKIDIRDCLVIEDSNAGIVAGFTSGAKVIFVPDVIKLLPQNRTKVFQTAKDLNFVTNIIDNLSQ